MNFVNQSCENSEGLQRYQHYLYAVVYSVILAPGLLGNMLALWGVRCLHQRNQKGCGVHDEPGCGRPAAGKEHSMSYMFTHIQSLAKV